MDITIEDDDEIPQDLSLKSLSNNCVEPFNKLNGTTNLEQSSNSSYGEVSISSVDSHELVNQGTAITNGTSNLVSNLTTSHPVSKDKNNRKIGEIQHKDEWDIPITHHEEQYINLKRKISDTTRIDNEIVKPVSPKQKKLSRPHLYNYRPDQHPTISANCVQAGLETLLNPCAFKNTDEMKYFLKHQLQFSDLGKLFGNVDFSSGEEHLNEYAQYLGLQPTVKFKCFKCDDSKFLTLTELKEHQVICLKSKKRPQDVVSNKKSEAVDGVPSSDCTNTKQIDTKIRITRKVFLCSTCGTYYENWNLFHHMREVHKRFICLHCLGIFPSAERLTHHLEGKHTAKPNIYEHKEQLLAAIKDQCYLMCCVCEHIFSEHDDFTNHSCENYIQPCSFCSLKFIHKPNCKASVPNFAKIIRHKDREKRNRSGGGGIVGNINSKTKRDHRQRKLKSTLQNESDKLLYEQSLVNGFDNGILEEFQKRSSLPISQPQLIKPPSPPILTPPETSSPIASSPTPPPVLPPLLPPTAPTAVMIYEDNSEPQQNDCNNSWPSESNINNNQNNDSSQIKHFFKHRDSLSDVHEDYLDARDMDILNGFINEDFEKLKRVVDREIENNANKNIINNGYDNKVDDIQPETQVSVTPLIPIEKPLLVPKLKLKISKEFQTPIESEESSTESDDDDIDVDVDDNEDDPVHQEDTPNSELKNIVDETNLILNIVNSPVNNDEEKLAPEEINHIEPFDGIVVAGDEIYTIELLLDQPLDKIPLRDFLRICLKSTFPLCLYCNHARKIAVDGNSLALHLISNHKFSATVDSITAEELHPTTIVQRIKSGLNELNGMYFNLDSYDNRDKDVTIPYEKMYECFQCRFQSRIHKDLYLHNRKMHFKSILLCLMCKSNFYSYSELVCHMCPGANNKLVLFELTFRCVLCNLDNIPSAFRLMVHLRKKHFACDVCLEECYDQSKLSSHVWKHKLHHLCYRCGIAYRNKPDITKHLFWKHGTESVLCKRCLQKKWPHVYHFCIPPSIFVCEICNLTFSKAVALKVHKRIHTEDAPYPCTEDNCEKKFISRKLLLKHVERHSMPMVEVKPIELIKQEPVIKEETKSIEEPVTDDTQTKKKLKKMKKNKNKNQLNMSNNLIDIIDLPAPNLSESDSSEESDNEKSTTTFPEITLSSVDAVVADDDDIKPAPIVDIWENFKSYQASQAQDKVPLDDNEPPPLPPPILHVTQSDHDYCSMYKQIIKTIKHNKNVKTETNGKFDDDIVDIENEISQSKLMVNEVSLKLEKSVAANAETVTSPKKGRLPKKSLLKSTTDTSSGDSSDSSSSCSCGSNCSCSTSSSDTSSSSSTSGSESSSSEGRKKMQLKKDLKKQKRNRVKSENSFKANLSDNIDVVTNDRAVNSDPDALIFESDLDTDESETDEDFYDDHPQRLASQMLAEKRKQLMIQTCMNPLNNYDIVENSRPSTPSLPEEMVKEKKVKAKKRKKDRKNSKNLSSLKINIPIKPPLSPQERNDQQLIVSPTLLSPQLPPSNSEQTNKIKLTLPANPYKSSTPAIIQYNKARLSTGSSCSDADTSIKRSKRRRIPNKFYGYTSDDEGNSMNIICNVNSVNAFKPQPPPNLTWHKEDLPQTPTIVRTPPIKTIIKIPPSINYKPTAAQLEYRLPSPIFDYKQPSPPQPSAPVITQPAVISTPVIPPIIIRPNRIIQQPAVVEPLRVPSVPVHHIIPPSNLLNADSEHSAESSDSDTSEEGALQISQPSTQITRLPSPILNHFPQLPPHVQQSQIRYPIMPPAGCRPAREGESVYCYCRCPYDEVSEMIACDGTDCPIEWFHFECVNIMVPPRGTWYCPQCRPKYIDDNQQHYQDIT